MKMKKEHYKILKEAMSKVAPETIKGHKEVLESIPSIRDVEKALRWDTLRESKIKIGDGKGMDGLPLYGYLDDNHIDTALKKIMKEIQETPKSTYKAYCPGCAGGMDSIGISGVGTIYKCHDGCGKEWVISKHKEYEQY